MPLSPTDMLYDENGEVCTGFRTIELATEPDGTLRVVEIREVRWVHCPVRQHDDVGERELEKTAGEAIQKGRRGRSGDDASDR